MFKGLKLTRGQEDMERLTATAIAKSYNVIGYDAVGVSKYDLSAGLNFLINLSKQSKFSWLSANLVRKSDSKPIFKAKVILHVNKLRIGVAGLTNMAAQSMLSAADGVVVLPWRDILPPLLKELKPQTDMIILLSNLSPKENRQIAEEFNDIHLIIQAGQTGNGLPPKSLNNTLICQTAKQGKYIGILDINWSRSKEWGIDKRGLLAQQRSALDRLNWQLSKYEKHGDPLQIFKNQPEKLQGYRRLLTRRQKMEKEIANLNQVISSDQRSDGPCTFKNRFIAMETSMPDEPEVSAIVSELNKKINAIGRAKAGISKAMHKTYTGWRRCRICHTKEAAAWQNTKHAKAYKTLVNRNRQFNIDCLFCHVTGISRKNAADAVSVSIDLRGVGCEACHGPGKEHIKDPKLNKLTARPEAPVCLSCHTTTHDDSFDYARDIKLVH